MTERTGQKPWFYKSDRYDDKFSLVVAWILSLTTVILWIGAAFAGEWRWFWAGVVAAIMQWCLGESQVKSGERNWEKKSE